MAKCTQIGCPPTPMSAMGRKPIVAEWQVSLQKRTLTLASLAHRYPNCPILIFRVLAGTMGPSEAFVCHGTPAGLQVSSCLALITSIPSMPGANAIAVRRLVFAGAKAVQPTWADVSASP
jgi:hypothetical protein